MMISPEERTRKPYALPVQCLAYVSLGDMAVRRICDVLIKEMSARGMKVAGRCTIIIIIFKLTLLIQDLQLMENGTPLDLKDMKGRCPFLKLEQVFGESTDL